MQAINKTACIGGGVIGSSWAVNFAVKGYRVSLFTRSEATLNNARRAVESYIGILLSNKVLTDGEAEAAKALVEYTNSIEEAAKNADLIQENGPDSIDLKREIIARIEEACPPDAVIASSTSNLSITEISARAKHPERIIGAHPFNPPHLIPLVEICTGERTSGKTVERTVDFYHSCGKEPVVLQKESIGFIANRLQMALYREAIDLVLRGVCDVADVDKAVTYGPGMRWAAFGPNILYQLGGGKNGLKGLLTALKAGGDALIADLADWKVQPPKWPDIAQEGVNKEMAAFPDFKGHTNEEIAEFRDETIIKLLKQHRKL